MKGDETQSGCRAPQIGSSLVEFTFTTTLIGRTNTERAVPEAENTWRKAHDYIGREIAAVIAESIEKSPLLLQYFDSPRIAEDIGSTAREVSIHSDHTHCSHGD